MYKIEYGIPQNHKVCDYDSFLAMGVVGSTALYIKIPNYNLDDDDRYMYLVFPNECSTDFHATYIKKSVQFQNFVSDLYYNFYNVEVTEFAPTVKICAKDW